MNELYDALAICLNEIEKGAGIDAVMAHYPHLADELRPLIESSLSARILVPAGPSVDVMRRNRVRVLQQAASATRVRSVFPIQIRRIAAAATVLLFGLASGTSLVSAATTSLPGDNLYPVKRSWEGLQIALSLTAKTREALEIDHENERIEELQELFAYKRSAEVTFNGILTNQNGTEWLVAGIPVIITPETTLPLSEVHVYDSVQVHGLTQPDDSVQAIRVDILGAGAILPEVEDVPFENVNQPGDGSKSSVATAAPESVPTSLPVPEDLKINGTLSVRDGDFWIINGVPSDVGGAEIEGIPAVGAVVTVEGYFDADGMFIVTKVKFDDTRTGEGRKIDPISTAGADSNGDSSGSPGGIKNDDDRNDR